MKHYSAELISLNDVNTGANLEIADGRARRAVAITAGAGTDNNTAGNEVFFADNSNGLIISGGNFNFILDGQGSQFDPNIGTDAAPGLLNIIRDIEFSSVTNMLHFSYDSDFALDTDGSVMTGTSDLSVSLASLAGGGSGSGASTNPTNHDVPVKQTQGVVDAFIDAPIVIETSGYFSETGLTLAVTNATTLSITGGTALTNFEDGDPVFINQIDSVSGNLETISGTISGTPTAGAAVVTVASGAATGLETAVTVGLYKVGTQGDIVLQGNVQINGNFQHHGDSTTVNTTQVNLNDSFIVLNHTTDAGTFSNMDGGVLITTDGDGSGGFSYAGIRVNASAASVMEIATDLSNNSGADNSGTWKEIVCRPAQEGTQFQPSAVFKIAGTFPAADQAEANNTPGITVATAGNITTWTITHRLGSNELTAQVFDSSGNQVLPDEVTVGNTTVAIQMPGTAADFATTDQHRFVIIG